MAGIAAATLLLAAVAVTGISPAMAASPPIPVPILSVSSPTVIEGDVGDKTLTFVLTLDRPAAADLAVDWATQDSGATAGSDYDATSGTLTILSGDRAASIDVVIHGDLLDEGNAKSSTSA